MTINRWNIPGVPHLGWRHQGVTDLKESGQELDSCGMCGKERIRFLHHMYHPDTGQHLGVGCVCAGHMIQDRKIATELERTAHRRARRLEKWGDVSREIKGRHTYFDFGKFCICITRTPGSNRHGFQVLRRLTRTHPGRWYVSPDYNSAPEADQAAFEYCWQNP